MQGGAAALGSLFVLGVVAVVAFLIFLVMREVWCWYWKINEAVGTLKDMQLVLRNIDKNLAARVAQPQPAIDHFGPSVGSIDIR